MLMKTFKEFMEQAAPQGFPQGSNINIVPGSGDIHRSRNGRRAFGFGRKNKVSDFNHLRYRADMFNSGPAKETLKKAPAFNAPSTTMRRPRRFETPDPKRPSHLM
jgi:hypothetical protein